MQPNNAPFVIPPNLKRGGAAVIAVLVVLFIGWSIYNSLTFRLTKTNPGLGNVSNNVAFIDIYFNHSLDKSDVKFSYSSAFIDSTKIDNQKIRLNTSPGALQINKQYTITLKEVKANNGKVITDRQLTFTAKDIPVDELDQEQQQALIARQDKYVYNVQHINYANFDSLLDSGLSANQLQTIKEDLYNYSLQARQEFKTMTLVKGSLVAQRHTSQSASLDDFFRFQVQLGSNNYAAAIDSDPIGDTAQLTLTSSTGTVIYDSTNNHD